MRIEEVPELIPKPVRAGTVSLRKPSDAGADDTDKLEQAIAESREIVVQQLENVVLVKSLIRTAKLINVGQLKSHGLSMLTGLFVPYRYICTNNAKNC
mgnify:CR=1 FL=1